MARRNKFHYRRIRTRLSFEGLETRRVLAADFSNLAEFSNLMVVVSPAHESGPDVAAPEGEDSSALIGRFLQVDSQFNAFSAGDAGKSVTPGTIDIGLNAFLSPTDASIAHVSSGSSLLRLEFGDGITDLILERLGDGGDSTEDATLNLSDSLDGTTISTTTVSQNQGGSDLSLDLPGSNLPPSFGVEPNRDVVPGQTDGGVSGDESRARSAFAIDIARNHIPRISGKLGDALQIYEASMIANTQPLEASGRVSFRVEPMMARAHRININTVPSETMVEMTNEALTELGADDLAAAELDVERFDNVEQPIVALASQTHPDNTAVKHRPVEQARHNTKTHHASQSPIVLEQDATIQFLDGPRSHWQTLVDILLAGGAGAMIYGGREEQREVRDFPHQR